ncbi:MAG: Mth938-like domain-containing protein [Candidatus Njordarchaeales archaeon]
MPIIEDYEFGEIKIGGQKYRSDVIVFPDKVSEDWWRIEGHNLHIEDLWEVIEYKPEILVIGTGYYGRMDVPREVILELEKKGIRVIVAHTREAVEIYNRYLREGRKVVAALHLTC